MSQGLLKYTLRKSSVVLAVIGIISILPNPGHCQTSLHMPALPELTSRDRSLISTVETKALVRSHLFEIYKADLESQRQNEGLYKFILKDDKKPIKENSNIMRAGGWTGGGGTGVACFNHELTSSSLSDQKNSSGRLVESAYEKMTSLTMIDYWTNGEAHTVAGFKPIPVLESETSIQYVRRLLLTHYAASAPIFVAKLLRYSELVNNEIEKQIFTYQLQPFFNPQLSLRDFGSAMRLKEQNLHRQGCLAVQLATRYAFVQSYGVKEFFIDFDVKLLLRMRALAKNHETAVAQEAALILHEAIYLMGSMLHEKNSEATSFIVVPYLLNKTTVDMLSLLTPIERAYEVRSVLMYAGMGYLYLLLGEEFILTKNKIVNQHLSAVQEITTLLSRALSEKSATSLEEVSTRERGNFLFVFADQLQTLSPTASFLAVAATVNPFFWDSLFLEKENQAVIIQSNCGRMRELGVNLSEARHESFRRTVQNALQYCNQFLDPK